MELPMRGKFWNGRGFPISAILGVLGDDPRQTNSRRDSGGLDKVESKTVKEKPMRVLSSTLQRVPTRPGF
eukprot:NODE_19827_length_826_cov_1.422031.p3 GENE.NODE_19827_length_826_cov_1.422031~~NODE_19827_length_826_cov_1.422031.p3  ORF type:complete len:70 (-),score=1.66 NODE_19827_length_826_cov_1.422031:28-237(-)